jgi:hypothetical protein
MGNGTKLTADYVIVTVPLGVLKQGSIGFEPPLPADKQDAIKSMVRTAAQAVFPQPQPHSEFQFQPLVAQLIHSCRMSHGCMSHGRMSHGRMSHGRFQVITT